MSLGWYVGCWAPGAVTVGRENQAPWMWRYSQPERWQWVSSVHVEPPNSLCSKHFLSVKVCERVCIWYFLTVVCDRKPGSKPSQCNQQVCPPWQACRVEMSSVYSLRLSFCFFISLSPSHCLQGEQTKKKQYMKAICLEGLKSCAQYISPLH